MPGFHAQRWALASLMKERGIARKTGGRIFFQMVVYVLRRSECIY